MVMVVVVVALPLLLPRTATREGLRFRSLLPVS
jgi:hypothetical protein